MKVTPRYRLTSALARLRAVGLTEAWALIPSWWSNSMLRGPSAEALVQELLGELSLMTGVVATDLYEPGSKLRFVEPMVRMSKSHFRFNPGG